MEINKICGSEMLVGRVSVDKENGSKCNSLNRILAKIRRLENENSELENDYYFLQNQTYDLDNHLLEVENTIADIMDDLFGLNCDIKNRIVNNIEILHQLEGIIDTLYEVLIYKHESINGID
ncbi:hypothetical protein [Liquorilactobacillus sp.]|uniref:hypothetical protein n=1 Tax=Liquorilactobacillus sp. TaxID=2767923 RepID=UPI0039EA9355